MNESRIEDNLYMCSTLFRWFQGETFSIKEMLALVKNGKLNAI